MERVFDNTILSNYKDIFKNLEDSIREYERVLILLNLEFLKALQEYNQKP